ncbi:type II secretion system protein [Salinithrix halophila]|uniref:Type II secretion system protein n=1 Tax=Salinithrix halophila TaxID=1485204 RepID=A0ABV8JDY6_9BACL
MIWDQKGFTLAETVTAMLIVGILLSTALPVALEINGQLVSRGRQMEAMAILESRMEEVQRSSLEAPASGKRVQQSNGVRYRIKWRKSRIGPRLTGSEVEVRWKDREKRARKLSLKSVQYQP